MNSNKIYIKYYRKTSEMSIKNIEDLEARIDDNSNNSTYLKNVYNILFYNKKTQVDFSDYFYEKIFEVNDNFTKVALVPLFLLLGPE